MNVLKTVGAPAIDCLGKHVEGTPMAKRNLPQPSDLTRSILVTVLRHPV
ncbi:MAG: hypothetical protein ACLQT6_03135 [Desulfomonilaceae bacterium]